MVSCFGLGRCSERGEIRAGCRWLGCWLSPHADRVAWFYQEEFCSISVHPVETLKAWRQNWFSKVDQR